jgi:molybdate transport system substrate-binding protein
MPMILLMSCSLLFSLFVDKRALLFSPSSLSNLSVSLSSSISKFFVILTLTTTSTCAATLTVAAAADLIQAQPDLAAAFGKRSQATVIFSPGASGELARQIENGAPFDVFLSANVKYVEDLAKKGFVLSNSVVVYAQGRLGLWSRDGKVRSVNELNEANVRIVALPNPRFAPYGLAAQQLLQAEGFWGPLQPKIVFGENVSQALQFAETGNADAVITSWTLVAKRGGVLLPAKHAPILQAAGIVARTGEPELARRFIEFLRSPEGRAILARYGLMPAPGASVR